MKKILIIAITFLLTTSLFTQTFRIVTFPFMGSELTTTTEGEFLASLFTSEFIPLGYTLVTRTTGFGVSAGERKYQTSGATAEIAKIGKQVAADYVLVGDLSTVFGQMSLTVEVIGVESSKIVASGTQRIASLDTLAVVAVDMVASLNSQIQMTGRDSKIAVTTEASPVKTQKITEELGFLARLISGALIQQDLEQLKKRKWAGRWEWIGGLASIGIGTMMMLTDDVILGAFGLFVFIPGGVIFMLDGVITDIVFSVLENNLLKDLESQGIFVSATPTIKPDLVSGTMNYGVQLGVKYIF